MDEVTRRRRAAWMAGFVLGIFLLLGTMLVLEIRSAQVAIWTSSLAANDKYLWFARLQTSKTIIAFVALLLGLIGGSYAWRLGQKPE